MNQVRIIGEARCRLETADKALSQLIDAALSFEVPGSQFSPRVKQYLSTQGKHGWDGRTHLLTQGSATFPLGLLDRVLGIAEDAGKPLAVLDERKRLFQRSKASAGRSAAAGGRAALGVPFPAVPATVPNDIVLVGPNKEPLRPDQVAAINAALTKQRGIIAMATGGGKTEVAIAISKWLLQHQWPGTILFVTNRKKLTRETVQRFKAELGDDVGMIGEGEWDAAHRVVVASIDSLALKGRARTPEKLKLRKKFFAQVTCLFVDEVHHVAARTWYRTVNIIPARIRIGLSGTALDRDDGKNLMTVGALGEVVYAVEAHELQKIGALATCTVVAIPCRTPKDLADFGYAEIRSQGIVHNLWRNRIMALRCQRLAKKGYKSVVLVQEIVHGDLLKQALRVCGINADFIHGQTPLEEQEAACARLVAGERSVLIASPIFREGVNMPAVDHIGLADGGKSVIATVQKVGRGLRRKAGRNHLLVTDFVDLTHPKLAVHTEKRLETYRSKKYPVVFKEAPEAT